MRDVWALQFSMGGSVVLTGWSATSVLFATNTFKPLCWQVGRFVPEAPLRYPEAKMSSRCQCYTLATQKTQGPSASTWPAVEPQPCSGNLSSSDGCAAPPAAMPWHQADATCTSCSGCAEGYTRFPSSTSACRRDCANHTQVTASV